MAPSRSPSGASYDVAGDSTRPLNAKQSRAHGTKRSSGLFHLREAVEADKCGRGFASSDVNDDTFAAVGVSLSQGSD